MFNLYLDDVCHTFPALTHGAPKPGDSVGKTLLVAIVEGSPGLWHCADSDRTAAKTQLLRYMELTEQPCSWIHFAQIDGSHNCAE